MATFTLTQARQRVLELLKRAGQLSAQQIGDRLGMTSVAARQHLGELEQAGLMQQSTREPSGRGRPGAVWSVTEAGDRHFPDRHADLTLGLIQAIRESVGEEGLHRIVEVRARDQANLYQGLMPATTAPLADRVHALADQRTTDGYMAEVIEEPDGSFKLIEHHCPICDAAKTCQGFCQAELDMFRKLLGPDVHIERTKHLLTDSDRCAYRIARATS